MLSTAFVSLYGHLVSSGSSDPFDYHASLALPLQQWPWADNFSFSMSTSADNADELTATYLTSTSLLLRLTTVPTSDMSWQLLSPPLSRLPVSTIVTSGTIAKAIPARVLAAWHRPIPHATQMEIRHLGRSIAPGFLLIWFSVITRGRVLAVLGW